MVKVLLTIADNVASLSKGMMCRLVWSGVQCYEEDLSLVNSMRAPVKGNPPIGCTGLGALKNR